MAGKINLKIFSAPKQEKMSKNLAKILIIAGSDPSGGAGIQADLKTATALKTYSGAVITSLTAQNTKKVFSIHNPPIEFLAAQLNAVLEDIKFDAIKIGMLSNREIIECVSDILNKKAKKIPLILDSVMVATSGDLLLEKNAVDSLKSRLVKRAYLVTPNIDEAEILSGIKITNIKEMQEAASIIRALGTKNVLIKGGHLNLKEEKITNLLLDEKGKFHFIYNKRLKNKKLHGTGCSLSSAITCNLAKKMPPLLAVKKANDFIHKMIVGNLQVGKGSLVLQHFI